MFCNQVGRTTFESVEYSEDRLDDAFVLVLLSSNSRISFVSPSGSSGRVILAYFGENVEDLMK